MSESGTTINKSIDRIALLDALLERNGRVQGADIIPRRSDTSGSPLSFSQERLWILDQLEPGAPIYNVPFAARMYGSLEISSLQAAIDAIVQRHQVLRTIFPSVQGHAVQMVLPAVGLPLNFVDREDLQESARESVASQMATEEARKPFDLAHGPLIRAQLVQFSNTDHLLLITMHHIVTDGWSRGVLIRELNELYSSFVNAAPTEIAELPIQYIDYAAWQRETLTGDTIERELAYWRQCLAGAPSIIELPTDRPRPAAKSYKGAIRELRIAPDVSDEIRSLARQEGASLFMTLLAAYYALLFRYSGQEDFVVGTPVANRNRPELEGLIGFFVNTLALRIDLSGDPSFRELVGRVRDVSLSAFEHQDLPFEKLVSDLQPDRNLSHTPLFQVMFALQNAARTEIDFAGVTLAPVERDKGTARVDLHLAMIDDGSTLGAAMEYDTDLFDAATIDRMLAHFRNLLAAAAMNPAERISALALLDSEERHKLLVEWNQPNDFPAEKSIHCLFEEQTERTPERTAISFEGTSLSYAELNARANRVAHFLKSQGVGTDVLVGLCVERSLEMIVGILGILKAGGAYVPLDPAYPGDRLAYMVADSNVPLVLTQRILADRIPGSAVKRYCLDSDTELFETEPDSNPGGSAPVDSAAYVIYTSGSTGKPKGVVVTHANVARLFSATDHWFGFNGNDVWTLFHSFAFDFSVWEIWGALLYGGRLVVVPYDVSRSPESFHKLLADEKVTVLNQTPSAFRNLIQADVASDSSRQLALRYVVFGGEKLELRSLLPWIDRHGDEKPRLINMYGITETTVHVTYRPLSRKDIEEAQGSLVGERIPDLLLYVLDSRLQPCPIGVAGEICVGGAGLARGYLNQPDLTNTRFVPNPFVDSSINSRLYRSGDLARYLQNGDIEYLGRIDHQVKIRGFRIELGEIESVIQAFPSIGDCVVLAREDTPGSQQLVAYLTLQANAPKLATAELRDHAKGKLPDYMIPAHFVVLEQLPLTVNGKIDTKALPAPEIDRGELESSFEPPETQVEQTLARIWEEILRVERIGIRDNFFELGGDSILSIRIVSRANSAGLRLTPKQMFQFQTIAELAQAAEASAGPTAEQGAVHGDIDLTPIQHWFFERNLADPHHYNQAVVLEPRYPVDPDLLHRAVNALIEHHDALRLRFAKTEGAWKQWNARTEENSVFSQIDLSAEPATERQAALAQTASKLQASLNLNDGPLIRVMHVQFGAAEPQRVVFIVHHMAVDGVSWRILTEDLETAYSQLARGEQILLPSKTTSFQEWARRLDEYGRSPEIELERPYWLRAAAERVFTVPVDELNGENTESSLGTVSSILESDETTALLQEVPQVYRTQINDVLLTALVRVLVRWTGNGKILIDLEGHGREDLFEGVDISRTIGWFTTIFPVVFEADVSVGIGDTLKSTKEQMRAIPNRGIGYGLLRYLSRDADLQARIANMPSAEISFNYLGRFDESQAETGIFSVTRDPIGPSHSPAQSRSHLLSFSARVAGGKLQLALGYSKALHGQATVQYLMDGYADELRALIEHCRQPDSGGYTPSDFKLAKVDQKLLDKLAAKLRNR